MCHDDHGHALFCDFTHDIQDFMHHFRVECRGRFIEEECFRLHRERAGDSDTLLLPTGELRRLVVCLVFHPDFFEELHTAVIGFLLGDLSDLHRREHQILNDTHMRKKVESLKDHADFRADFIDILFSIDRHTVECDGSRRRCFKPIDAAQQRTLPRAGRSDDDDDFLLLDFDADVFQDRQIAEFFADVGDFYQIFFFCHLFFLQHCYHSGNRQRHDKVQDSDGGPYLKGAIGLRDDELSAAGQLFEADDGNQRGILQHCDEFIAERRQDISYSLRQDDIVHGLPPGKAERATRFHLPHIDRLDAGAENFRYIRAAIDPAGSDSRHEWLHTMPRHDRESEIDQEDLYQKRRTTDTVCIDRSQDAQHLHLADTRDTDEKADAEADENTDRCDLDSDARAQEKDRQCFFDKFKIHISFSLLYIHASCMLQFHFIVQFYGEDSQ